MHHLHHAMHEDYSGSNKGTITLGINATKNAMSDVRISQNENQKAIQSLAELKQRHRELDISIEQISDSLHANQLEIKRLKKQKLLLKDAIVRLESKLIPDLHA